MSWVIQDSVSTFLSFNPGRIFGFALSEVHIICGHSILTLVVLCAVMENWGRAQKRTCWEEQFWVLSSAPWRGHLPVLCSTDQAGQKNRQWLAWQMSRPEIPHVVLARRQWSGAIWPTVYTRRMEGHPRHLPVFFPWPLRCWGWGTGNSCDDRCWLFQTQGCLALC